MVDFKKFADPESLRKEFIEKYPYIPKDQVDDMINDDRTRHMFELTKMVMDWAEAHSKILRTSGDKDAAITAVAGDLIKVVLAFQLSTIKRDPISIVLGARALASIYHKLAMEGAMVTIETLKSR